VHRCFIYFHCGTVYRRFLYFIAERCIDVTGTYIFIADQCIDVSYIFIAERCIDVFYIFIAEQCIDVSYILSWNGE